VRVPRPLTATVLSLALGTALVACGGDDKGKDTKVTIDTSSGEKTDGNAVTLKARLTGAEEVPGPGVKDGIGAFLIDIGGGKGCYDLKVTMGEKPTKAHIHEGAAGVSGPVVVDLKPTFEPGESAMTAKSCVDLSADLGEKLVGNPAAYYVNVHSEGHPDGAIRGQLATF
jgi:hypothetical protein